MKRLGLASGIIAGTFVLGILAVSVAQNDSRRQSADLEISPTYDDKDVGPVYLPNNMQQMAAKFAIKGASENSASSESTAPIVPPPMSVPPSNDAGLPTTSGLSLGIPNTELSTSETANLQPPKLQLPNDATVRANDDQIEAPAGSPDNTRFALGQTPPPIGIAEREYASLAQATEPVSGSNARGTNQVLSPPNLPSGRSPSASSANLSSPPRPSLSPPTGDSIRSRGAPSRSPVSASSLPNIPELRASDSATSNRSQLAPDSRNSIPTRTVATPTQLEQPRASGGLSMPGSPPGSGPSAPQNGLVPPLSNQTRPNGNINGAANFAPQQQMANPVAAPQQSEMGDLMPRGNRTANRSMSHTMSSVDAVARLAQATPGARNLDGNQRPIFEMQKRAPQEIQVGVPVVFTTVVSNVGNATGYEVKVVDRIPAGTRLTQTVPTAEVFNDLIVWTFDKIDPGGEQTLSMELVSEQEGEVGSVASISFSSLASVRTVSTKPVLEVRQSADPSVRIGNPTVVNIAVSNSGSGVARDVSIQADVPRGLRHPSGSEIEVAIGDLQPGETRTVELELMAAEPGMSRNIVRAVAENLAEVASQSEIEIIAPKLEVAIAGPSRRFLERPATYQLTVTNSGTAIARNIELITYLDQGLQFISAINAGEYLANNHAAAWGLDELQPGATATTELTVMPVQEGDFVLRLQADGEGVNAEPMAKNVSVEGQSELSFTVSDDNDPVETYGETTYTINIANIGTRVDHNVQLMVELPQGATVRDVSAPVAYQANDSRLMFEPINEMKAKDQQTIRFTLAMAAEGVQVLRAHLRSELRPVEVIKEESTQVYLDR